MESSDKTPETVEPCRVGEAAEMLASRWKGQVLWYLQDGPMRFMELRRSIPSVSPKVLTHKLRELERDGLILREHHSEIPPRVEYSLTPLGRSAIPVLGTIERWWQEHGSRAQSRAQSQTRDRSTAQSD